MSKILDWIFEGIVNWIASLVTAVMDAISGIFLGALGTDMVVMEEYFPFITRAFSIMQYFAWCLLFIITVWQLFRAFGGPITEAENPWHLLVRSAIFAILIGFARPIFSIALDIARAPYTALMDASMNPGDFTFAGVENVLMSSLVTLLGVISIVGLLLMIILMICLGWNYFKLLLEVVERYIVVGVLCYTSPLAFAMGGSKTTNKVFQSWCKMVGSQLLLLVMNVWFLRAFNSSVGHFAANAGATTSGHGNVFLWMFCALAFLKTAQKFDSFLASMGLNVAQTGSGMGMELLMATRLLGGFGGGGGMGRTAGNMFRGGSGAAGTAASAGAGGFASGFASKFKGNSYVRDSVVQGGSRMGAGGGLGFVGRAFGGMAARTGATLTGDSISSVAARHPAVSGSIGGDIANRSLQNYMPQLTGKRLSDTQITGGQISATATGANGREASLQMYSAAQYDRPDTPHSVVRASDGSTWYQTATGAGMGEYYSTPAFAGDASEAAQIAAAFPGTEDGTMLRTVDDGVMEATYPDGSNSMWYNSAHYDEPSAPHDTVTSANGVSWYAMEPQADTSQFDTGDGSMAGGITLQSGGYQEPGAARESTTLPGGDYHASDVTGDGVTTQQGGGYQEPGAIRESTTLPGGDHHAPDSKADGVTIQGGVYQDHGAIREGSTLPGGDYRAPDAVGDGATLQGGSHHESGALSGGSTLPGGDHHESISLQEGSTLADGMRMSQHTLTEAGHTDSGSVGVMAQNLGAYQDPPALQDTAMLPGGSSIPGARPGPEAHSYDPAAAAEYNKAQFQQFMPGYEQQVSRIDASRKDEGVLEVRHKDGTGTAFYDKTMYQAPRGDHQVFEDRNGAQWYAVQGTPTVERRPVYEDGKPVYDGKDIKTENVEGMKYKAAPAKYGGPQKRGTQERKPPRRKQ